ncbi:MAG: hypothetical protein CBARDMAM_5509 [uncultured Caballeronia sp.]|nr:MAG: hypothetical protein CBARDMAM_5509 [uncultured Caballeronia sp.]
MKDAQARYALVNRALASRCGLKDKLGLLGKTAEEVFPQRFGRISYRAGPVDHRAGQPDDRPA